MVFKSLNCLAPEYLSLKFIARSNTNSVNTLTVFHSKLTLMSCWLIHLSHSLPSLKFTIFIHLSIINEFEKIKRKKPSEQLNPVEPLWHEQTLGPLQLPRYKQWFSNSHETTTENENYKLYKLQSLTIIKSFIIRRKRANLGGIDLPLLKEKLLLLHLEQKMTGSRPAGVEGKKAKKKMRKEPG